MFSQLITGIRKAMFADVTPLIRQGRAKPLQVEDLPPLPAWLAPASYPRRFLSLSQRGPWRFLGDVLRASGKRLGLAAALVAALVAVNVSIPAAMRALVEELTELCRGQGSVAFGVALTLGFSVLMTASSVVLQHYFNILLELEQLIINGLNVRVFGHALGLSRAARQGKPIGDIINHMGTDTSSIGEIPIVAAELLYGFGIIVSVAVMACRLLGPSALVALMTLAVLSPLCRLLAKRFVAADDRIMQARDRRVSLMSQIVAGIRVVKYLAWENRMAAEVETIRAGELAARRRLALATSASLLLFLAAQALATVGALATYVLTGHTLDAATAFAVIALFDLWQHPFSNLTNYIADLAAAKVGAERLIAFFKTEQLPPDDRSEEAAVVPGLCLTNFAASFAGAAEPVLKQWNLSLPGGTATAIVGAVGAGKSSFLLALLGELPASGGSCQWVGLDAGKKPRVAWVPQMPWIVNGTVQDNITLGGHPAGVEQAVFLTAMARDVAAMPAGLATEIGEQGINLSGGQKQRLSLARAVQHRPTVALLDDPFSAVDGATERFLVDELVFGEWQNVTRIVTTHRLDHLHRFDRIVFVAQGEIRAMGTLPDLLRWSDDFRAFYAEHQALNDKAQALAPVAGKAASEVAAPTTTAEASGDFTDEEDREKGRVRAHVYLEYVKALGGATRGRSAITVGLLILATAVAGGMPLIQNYWLSIWTGGAKAAGSGIRSVLIYGAIAALGVACAFGRQLFWSLRAVGAGQLLHQRALRATLATTVRFFDANPVGRILNRFSLDVDSVERQMSVSVEQMALAFARAALTIGLILALSPWTLVVLVPSVVAFYRLQDSYRRSARETKRLNAVTRSPRFAHFKETLEGLETVRALGKQTVFWQRFDHLLAVNQQTFRAMVVTNRWFSARLPLLTSVVSLVSVTAALLAARRGLIDPAHGALLLFYNFMFTDYLNWCVRSFSEAESKLTSVERLQHYGRLEPEVDTVKPAAKSLEDWPFAGKVEFKGVRARYAGGLPEVLRGVSLKIPAGAKVGIVGRTGAGKTSLIQVLYRFVELDAGAIEIDGVDIAAVPKAALRRALAIIPQNPTLFLGTLRDNLDRFGEFADAEIWEALAGVQLAEFVGRLPGGLAAAVQEGGANFSDGQRQLMCLARALLSKAQIIIMDEATASVDVVTDQMIHRAIQEAFHDRTMLIIAHRLGTISHCDQVIEMEQGVVRSVTHRQSSGSSRGGASKIEASGSSRPW